MPVVKDLPHTIKVNGRISYRRDVPIELQGTATGEALEAFKVIKSVSFGRKRRRSSNKIPATLKISLETKDDKTAKDRWAVAHTAVEALFAVKAYKKDNAVLLSLSKDKIELLGDLHKAKSLEWDAMQRAIYFNFGEPDEEDTTYEDNADKKLSAFKRTIARNDIQKQQQRVESMLQSLGIKEPRALPEFNDLIPQMIKAEKDALEGAVQRNEGEIVDFRQSKEVQNKISDTSTLFSKIAKKYLTERKKGRIKPRSLLQIEGAIQEFREKIGDRPIDGYTKKDGRKYFEYLKNKPARGKVGQPINPTTINTNMGYISKLFRWAIPRYDEDIINPLEGFRMEKTKKYRKEKKHLPFTKDELEKMVPLLDKKPEIYWPTLVGMYTGLREGAIIQLRRKDIKTEDGILYFDIHEYNESLKTESSIIQIPVHKTLLKLGFAEFVKKTKTVQLFAIFAYGPRGLDEGKNDVWARRFYRKWEYFMTKHGIKHYQLDFHSLRNNFADACRIDGVPEFIWGWLQGRSERGSVGDYGIGPNMKKKKTEIDKIRYGLSIEG